MTLQLPGRPSGSAQVGIRRRVVFELLFRRIPLQFSPALPQADIPDVAYGDGAIPDLRIANRLLLAVAYAVDEVPVMVVALIEADRVSGERLIQNGRFACSDRAAIHENPAVIAGEKHAVVSLVGGLSVTFSGYA